MLFSTPLFLFWFLPIVLLIYVLLPGIRARNTWLLLASLVFYAWGEPGFILMLLLSALVNYVIGRAMERDCRLGNHHQHWPAAVLQVRQSGS
jgi:alginate O-acetyltransferase complex protein AlgI